MRWLHAEGLPSDDVVRTFSHSSIGALVLSALFTVPMVVLAWSWQGVSHVAGSVPWFAWIVLGPLALIGLGIGWLCLAGTRALFHAACLPSNWLVKTTRGGLYLHLRSYQNHHFPPDVPTVAYLAFAELVSMRRVQETYDARGQDDRSSTTRKWLELTLANGDTAELEAWLAAELARPAPETRLLGVTSRTRFHHHPVLVPRPGVLYVEWLGRGMWKALSAHVPAAVTTTVALDAPRARALETRLRELVARGDTFAAIALAREERHLSLTEAHSLIETVRTGEAAETQR